MITVALPAFKSRYLKEAVSSLLAQTYADFELVVVDDASPEDLASVLAGFPDPRIKYHRNPVNLGGKNLVANWNRCLELAKGDWFVLASDDDVYHPEFLAEMVGLSGRYPSVDIFHSRVSVIDTQGVVRDFTSGCPEWESADDFLWHRLKRLRLGFIPEFFFRTSALRGIGGFIDFAAAWGSDVATCTKVGERHGIVASNRTLLSWRRSGMNISTSDRYLGQKLQGLEQFTTWCDRFLAGKDDLHAVFAREEMSSFRESRLAGLMVASPIPDLLRNLLLGSRSASRKVAARAMLLKMKQTMEGS